MIQKKGQIERNKQITLDVLDGESFVSLAKKHKISAVRVRGIFHESIARSGSTESFRLRKRIVRSVPLNKLRGMKDLIIERLQEE